MTNLETFTRAYIEALYFSDTGEEGQPPADAELAEETRLDIEADCRSWWRRFGCYVTTEQCTLSAPVIQAGHDFHFTRNGHGVGFWENHWPKPYRDLLTQGAQSYGTFEIYEGDDGLIYGG